MVGCATGSEPVPEPDRGAGAGSGGGLGAGGSAGAASGSGGGSGGESSATSASAAGSGGAGGACQPGPDTDGDGIDDCSEDTDGDPWTDKDVFNGMHVRLADECSASPSCTDNDTLAEVDACMAAQSLLEEKDQHAGWDFDNQPDDDCSAGYGFAPAWTTCVEKWQADWQGFVSFPADGQHCFAIAGNLEEQCGALFFDTETAAIQTGAAPGCFDVKAGSYPIRWHYTIDNSGSDKYGMHVRYCFGGAAPCVPSAALPASMLRPSL